MTLLSRTKKEQQQLRRNEHLNEPVVKKNFNRVYSFRSFKYIPLKCNIFLKNELMCSKSNKPPLWPVQYCEYYILFSKQTLILAKSQRRLKGYTGMVYLVIFPKNLLSTFKRLRFIWGHLSCCCCCLRHMTALRQK